MKGLNKVYCKPLRFTIGKMKTLLNYAAKSSTALKCFTLELIT